ncbi:hypothetical protein DB30_05886 [Enhygromyxa salina]|uniref:Lipoprotein n=1 Tax=Enhygromyxa salina TaxID=215803 RepID=A0A0C2CVT7_9BACT|nr:hypothetical protein [Enhygromyxa salina]KIG15186.1 hypothetical protein DB30_05886 [Enhygromyxa salina]
MTRLRWVGLLALGLVAVASCGIDEGYDNNDLELAVRQKAKETCSCLFVMELPEEHCTAWTRVSPDVAAAKIDRERQRVSATALGLWSASAHFNGRTGCVLDN